MGNAESSSPSSPAAAAAASSDPGSGSFSRNRDDYTSVEEVQRALERAGLESSDLIVGIDFTKSNEWTGKRSYGGRSLHAVGAEPNPYEQALSILGRTLASFDDDNNIPCFGFGDSSTHDKAVFSFYPDHRPCVGFEDALARYRTIVPHVRLAGPTSFAPIINTAVDIVEASGGQYHVLVIIAGWLAHPQPCSTLMLLALFLLARISSLSLGFRQDLPVSVSTAGWWLIAAAS
jgi:E3 ubiquitin-protein ligase RGLG